MTGQDRLLRRRSLLRAGLAGVGALAAGACSRTPGVLDVGREQGFLRLGIANERPFGYVEIGGKLTGYGPEVARRVLARLDVPKVVGVVTDFGQLIPGLRSGAFDIISAGMFASETRCAQIDFSLPTYCASLGFAVRAGSRIASERNIVDPGSTFRVAVLQGSVEQQHLGEAGMPAARTLVLPDFVSMAKAVVEQEADALALSSVSLRTVVARNPGRLTIVPSRGTSRFDGCGAFGFRRDDRELRDRFNGALDQMAQSGDLGRIATTFGFEQVEISAARAQGARDLCAHPVGTGQGWPNASSN